MDNILYSIIVPHKNQPKLLVRLLNSIPDVDYIEVIIVDDDSDSKIVDFDNFPGKERKQVHFIFNKDCSGPGHARNLGLDQAKGKWILFADSDDYFMPGIEDFFAKYAESDADMVYFNAICLDSETNLPGRRVRRHNRRIETYKKDKEKGLTLLRYTFGEPWCKLIKRDVIESHHIRFPHRLVHEDTELSYLVGYYAQKFEVEEKALYCVTFRNGSLSYSPNERKRADRIEAFAKAEKFFADNGVEVPFVNPMWFHYYQLCWSRYENKETYNNGFNLMLNLGFTKGHIYKGMLKLFPRFLIIFVLSKFVSKNYKDV